jgi:hypothetical protein
LIEKRRNLRAWLSILSVNGNGIQDKKLSVRFAGSGDDFIQYIQEARTQ